MSVPSPVKDNLGIARLAYTLCVDLRNVGKPLRQDVTRHLVSIFVSELGSLALGALRKRSGVGNRTGHDAANRGGDLEDVGHGGWVDQLVLFWRSACLPPTGRVCCE